MKRTVVFILLVLSGSCLSAQTLFTYGKYKVDKAEFLRAFYKNNTGDKSGQAMHKYLDLFIAFKLKVQAAKDRKMDTLPGQKNDLLNFRRQIETDYLTSDSIVHALVKEAFNRSRKDIHIAHIFIPFDERYVKDPSVTPGNAVDTLAAWQNIQKAYEALKNGADFGLTAEKYSLDPSVENNKGDIGFITVFSLPYPLESVAYTLQTGTFSMPCKSRAGYHIIKKIAERPAFGRMRAAQILLAYTPAASNEERQKQKKLADSLYNALKQGGDFEALARQFSSERNASTTGGLMPDFGVGRYDPVFENAVLSLKNDGDISVPFETAYGIHLVKRIKHLPVSSDSSQAEALLKTAVSQDSRIDIAGEQFTAQMLQHTGYQKKYSDALLWAVTDSFLARGNFIPSKGIDAQAILFSFDKENTTVNDWLTYIQAEKNKYSGTSTLPYPAIMKTFVSLQAKDYYRAHLEDYNADFRNQLTEFSEGNQLFEIMEQEVWSKAAEDKKGLQQYYEKHKEKYTWGPSVNAIFFTTDDRKTAEDISRDIENYIKKWRTLAESSAGRIIADSARFELGQVPGAGEDIRPGQITTLVTDPSNGSTNFMYVLNVYHEPAQRSFDEARGLVINDYQAVLEEKWIKVLKKKYRVKVNEKILQTIAH
ncbi:peptidylprolyl isomerase [Agriterribacter sp.]|uniref:peptidylprolyl isomerase n=1 Tax=Agriterribacter sp. TaxID=2821509 RepID=UPI002C7AD15D|nr:peptidylprolyl isomerase [Agriterribacter sp.]HRP56973.1 peptidylprolyl isomerase [Agriterribacter sp.]